MSNMSASDITKALFESMDTIIAARINNIAFDRTIVCEIVDNTYSADGKYTVQKDLTKFEAYCENETKYLVGEKVNVLVPEGDYKRQKVIMSKYQETNAEPIAYVAPLGSMVAIETIDIPNDNLGLIANVSTEKTIWEADLSTYQDAISNNGIYNALGLSVKFKTLLGDKQVCQGDYGLKLSLGILNDNKEVSEAYEFRLNTSDMFGNPYNYKTYFSFSKKIDISKIGTIGPVRLSLYQNSNFKYYDTDGTKKVYSYSIPEEELANNILAKDIKLIFGLDAVTATDNTFVINTHNKLEYNNLERASDCVRTLYSTWFNKDENSNEYLGYSDGTKVVNKMRYTEYLYAELLDKQYAGAKTAGDITIPQSREALQIYYNRDIIQSNYVKLSNYLSKDIYQIITEVEKQLKYCNVPEDAAIHQLFNPIYEAILNEDAETGYVFEALPFSNVLPDIENANTAIQDYYNFLQLILAYTNNARVMLPKAPVKLESAIALRQSKQQIFDLIQILNNGLIDLFNTYTGLKSYWENKFAKIADLEKVINELEDTTIKLVEITDENAAALRADAEDKELIDFATEYDEFKKQYENRYYLIWYRANPEASDEFAGEGWENILEVAPRAEDGANQTFKLENYTLDFNLLKEKFKAILFFNHVPYESNVIEFTNLNPPKEISDAQKINALSIELGDNAKDLYVSYTAYLTLLNLADKSIHRYLSAVHKEGNIQDFADSYIYWYLPTGNTMLDCNIDHLAKKCGLSLYTWLEPDEQPIEDDRADFSAYFKEGYHNFYRKLGATVSESDLQFAYLIKDFYTPSAINNTIKCKIVDSDGFEYDAERAFAFDTFGSNGTDYTLSLRPAGPAAALTRDEEAEEEAYLLDLLARLTDPDGELVPDKTPTVKFEANGRRVGSDSTLIYNGSATDYKYGIATATITNKMITNEIEADETLELTALYPVPLTTGNYYIEGPTTIIYSHLGTEPSYSDIPYRIYEVLEGEEPEKDGSHQELTNVIWELHYYNSKDSSFVEVLPTDPLTDKELEDSSITQESKYRLIINGQPKLQNKNTGVHLQPATMYITNDMIKTSIVCKNKDTNEILYIQPILILQNQHTSSMLNKWDEKLTIDEKNGTILSAMMGAGYKDSGNKFYGVLMGDSGKALSDQPGVNEVGLFGFHEGVQSFSLTNEGKMTLGKSGRGQIIMDGNTGVIQNAAWNEEEAGTKIDLDDGWIKLQGDKNGDKQAQVFISNGVMQDLNNPLNTLFVPYFKIDDTNGNNLIHIGAVDSEGKEQAFYLQSANYVPDESGLKFDLAEGRLDAFNFKIEAKNEDNAIIIDSSKTNDYPLVVGKNFKVNWNGDLTAKNAAFTGGQVTIGDNFTVDTSGNVTIKGSLEAGSIGPFVIDNNSIYIGSWQAPTGPSVFMCSGSTTSLSLGGSEVINNWAFGAGGLFGVTNSGYLYADYAQLQNAVIISKDSNTNIYTSIRVDQEGISLIEKTGSIGGFMDYDTRIVFNKYGISYSGKSFSVPVLRFQYDTEGQFEILNISNLQAGEVQTLSLSLNQQCMCNTITSTITDSSTYFKLDKLPTLNMELYNRKQCGISGYNPTTQVYYNLIEKAQGITNEIGNSMYYTAVGSLYDNLALRSRGQEITLCYGTDSNSVGSLQSTKVISLSDYIKEIIDADYINTILAQ